MEIVPFVFFSFATVHFNTDTKQRNEGPTGYLVLELFDLA